MATMTSEERLEEFKKVYHQSDATLKWADLGVVLAYFVIIIGIGIFVSKLYHYLNSQNVDIGKLRTLKGEYLNERRLSSLAMA